MEATMNGAELSHLQACYLEWVDQLERYARKWYRCRPGRLDSEDFVAEVIALGWHKTLVAWRRRKAIDPQNRLRAKWLCCSVMSGQRISGNCKVADVCSGRKSRRVQRPHGPRVPLNVQNLADAVNALPGRDGATPAEEACFRLDWDTWLATRTDEEQMLMYLLSCGMQCREIARWAHCGIDRMTDLRNRWRTSWTAFQGEPAASGVSGT